VACLCKAQGYGWVIPAHSLLSAYYRFQVGNKGKPYWHENKGTVWNSYEKREETDLSSCTGSGAGTGGTGGTGGTSGTGGSGGSGGSGTGTGGSGTACLPAGAVENAAFGDTYAYVACVNAPPDPNSFTQYKPDWFWLKDVKGDYVKIRGTWKGATSCSVDAFDVQDVSYEKVKCLCKAEGYDWVMPANSLLSYYYRFQVGNMGKPYWHENKGTVWNSYEKRDEADLSKCGGGGGGGGTGTGGTGGTGGGMAGTHAPAASGAGTGAGAGAGAGTGCLPADAKEDASFGDTYAYVACVNAPKDKNSFTQYKPDWFWLKDGKGDYVKIRGTWRKPSCSVDTFEVQDVSYEKVKCLCKTHGYDWVMPANSLVSYYYRFQVGNVGKPYWHEVRGTVWNSYENRDETDLTTCGATKKEGEGAAGTAAASNQDEPCSAGKIDPNFGDTTAYVACVNPPPDPNSFTQYKPDWSWLKDDKGLGDGYARVRGTWKTASSCSVDAFVVEEGSYNRLLCLCKAKGYGWVMPANSLLSYYYRFQVGTKGMPYWHENRGTVWNSYEKRGEADLSSCSRA
jgi:hypothetical protein